MRTDKDQPGGVVHTYLGYDPQRFPMPAAEAPDLVTPAFEHMLAYGNLRHLTEEELANAIELDPSQITGLGPSLSALLAMLEERKRKILNTYEVEAARKSAAEAFREAAAKTRPEKRKQSAFDQALRNEQI